MAAPKPVKGPTVIVTRDMGGLVFDAVVSEGHSTELVVTDNPVETGVVVSDHAYMQPLRLTIEGVVTDTPLRDQNADPFAPDPYASPAGRSRKAWELLEDLQRLAEPFDVQTGLKLYKSMVILSLRCDQDKDSSSAIFFTAELREVVIVSTATVGYPPRKPQKPARQAAKKVVKASGPPEKTSSDMSDAHEGWSAEAAPTTEKAKTLLASLKEGLL